jgi:hypothetical protein
MLHTVKARHLKTKKSQTAIEFLSTYTWAFILIAIVIAIVVALSLTRSPTTYSLTHCFIQPELPCEGFIIMSNGTGSRAVLAFLNNLGSNITLPSNAFVVQEPLSSTVFHGQCLPAKGPEGSLIICNATMDGYAPSVGTQLSPTFSVSYRLCSNGCSSTILNSSGSSTLFVSPSENLTDRITLLTSTGTGFVVLGGTAYPSNTVVAIIKGLSYPLYASPPNGYAFSTWTSSAGIAFEYPSQSTNITDQNIGTTGHIEANFNKVITTSTTTISTIITGSPTNPISNPVSNPISNPASNGVSNTASGAATNSPSGGATNSPSSSASGVSSSSSSSKSTNGASKSTGSPTATYNPPRCYYSNTPATVTMDANGFCVVNGVNYDSGSTGYYVFEADACNSNGDCGTSNCGGQNSQGWQYPIQCIAPNTNDGDGAEAIYVYPNGDVNV